MNVTVAGVRRWLVEAFTHQLALKGIAIALAIVLWFLVSVREPSRELVAVRFVPELDSGLALRDPTPPIRALVIGTGSELLKLYSTPPVIRKPVAAGAPDTLLVDIHPRDVILPEGVDAIVQDVQPRTLTLWFESTLTRRLPVSSALLVAGTSGERAFVRLDPDTVEVQGPRLAVIRLTSVSTVRQTIGPQDSVPHLVDLDTAALAGMRVRPTQVKALVRLVPATTAFPMPSTPPAAAAESAGATSAPVPRP